MTLIHSLLAIQSIGRKTIPLLLHHLLLHFGWDLGSHCRGSVRENIKKEESSKWAQVKATNGGNDSAKEVQERISDLIKGLEDGNSLCLGDPRQEDSSRNHQVVSAEEISKATDKDLLGNTVARDGHGS